MQIIVSDYLSKLANQGIYHAKGVPWRRNGSNCRQVETTGEKEMGSSSSESWQFFPSIVVRVLSI